MKNKSTLDETKAAAKGENGNVRIGFVGNAVAAGLVEHRSMYSYVRLSIESMYSYVRLSIDRCTATYV